MTITPRLSVEGPDQQGMWWLNIGGALVPLTSEQRLSVIQALGGTPPGGDKWKRLAELAIAVIKQQVGPLASWPEPLKDAFGSAIVGKVTEADLEWARGELEAMSAAPSHAREAAPLLPCGNCGCEERDHRGILTCRCPDAPHCQTQPHIWRVCERGTKGCNIRHRAAPAQ